VGGWPVRAAGVGVRRHRERVQTRRRPSCTARIMNSEALTCRFKQERAWAFDRRPIGTPLPAACQVLSTPALSQLKVTAVWLRANAAAKTRQSPTGLPEPYPGTTDDTDRASRPKRRHTPTRNTDHTSPGSCSPAPDRSKEHREHARFLNRPERTPTGVNDRRRPAAFRKPAGRLWIDTTLTR
jgi:hypothetical protein